MNINNILFKQKEELEHILSGKIVPRDVKTDIKKDIIKVITGPRRSGKSTLALILLKNEKFAYINFDERELLDFDSISIEKALKEVYGDFDYIILDEIQNYNKWELWANSLYRRGHNLIITGSNARLLSKELSTHLTGRYIPIELFPFSFKEVLYYFDFDLENVNHLLEKQGEILNILRDYMVIGGFPEIWVKNLDKEYLRTLFDNIVYKDIVLRWSVKYPEKVGDLARYFLDIVSNKYTLTKLKNILEFSSKVTIEKYIKYLEEAYLIFSLNKFSFKTKEILRSPKKVYIVDNGFVTSFSLKNNIGSLMENIVFLALRRKYKENQELFYYQDPQGYEIDFLIKEGPKIKELIQVTYASEFDEIAPREYRALIRASEVFKGARLSIITWDYEDQRVLEWWGKKALVRFVPLWKWLL